MDMRDHSTLSDSHFPPGDALQDGHALLQKFIAFDVNKIGARQAMLGNKDWLLVPLEIREEFASLPLQDRDE